MSILDYAESLRVPSPLWEKVRMRGRDEERFLF
jgi:hypothetical protein